MSTSKYDKMVKELETAGFQIKPPAAETVKKTFDIEIAQLEVWTTLVRKEGMKIKDAIRESLALFIAKYK